MKSLKNAMIEITMAEIAPRTKAVIWDLDGTLLDSFGIFKDLVADLAPAFDVPVPDGETFLANYHGTIQETLINLFGDQLGEADRERFAERFLKEQDGKYAEVEIHLLEDALRLSKELSVKGIKQAIVTNRGHIGRGRASPRSIVESSSLKDHIQHIVCGDDTEARKPDVAVLGTLLDDWGVSPDEILIIGDQFVDAQFALNIGARGIVVARNGGLQHTEKLPADWQKHITVVSSLDEVL